jgi:hypothetical protein
MDLKIFKRHAKRGKHDVQHPLRSWVDVVLSREGVQGRDPTLVTLRGAIFNRPINPVVLHQVVRWQRAKRRKVHQLRNLPTPAAASCVSKTPVGNLCTDSTATRLIVQPIASTKTRAEVSGGGRKPLPQKGSGRARQGTNRAPHMRGGGIVFGPKPRSFAFKLPKRVASFLGISLEVPIHFGSTVHLFKGFCVVNLSTTGRAAMCVADKASRSDGRAVRQSEAGSACLGRYDGSRAE